MTSLSPIITALILPIVMFLIGKLIPADRQTSQAAPTEKELQQLPKYDGIAALIMLTSMGLMAWATGSFFTHLNQMLYHDSQRSQLFSEDILFSLAPLFGYIFFSLNISLFLHRIFLGQEKFDRMVYLQDTKHGVSNRKFAKAGIFLGSISYILPLIFLLGWRAEIKDDQFIYKKFLDLQASAQPLKSISKIAKIHKETTNKDGEPITIVSYVLVFQDGNCWSDRELNKGDTDVFYSTLSKATAQEIISMSSNPSECKDL